jgi:hypothetical protein
MRLLARCSAVVCLSWLFERVLPFWVMRNFFPGLSSHDG